ncbi:uncharacterized protein LOC108040759 [Drosophila rhopaloa]|uniref:Uncharacterized protein LOC108040759 n=1 Tax=Drosophila rhopaloa TaxID=1041015 RepID=A0A6P4EKV1_DRORH|nr:uncharacterized protein LOC108040759 [Drosophila rhopaloa]
MFCDSSIYYRMLWPPAPQLLNFPPNQQQEQIPRPVVQFEGPPGHQLDIAPRRWRSPRAVPDGEVSREQPTRNGPTPELLFVRRCYMLAGLFSMSMAILAMILTKAFPQNADPMIPGFVCAMVSLLVLFVLCIGGKLRQFYWFSLVLSALFVQLAGVGVILVLLDRCLEHVCSALLAAMAAMVGCYFAGAWLPRIVLPGEATMILLLIVFVVCSIFVMTMYIFTDNWIYQTLYFLLMAIMLVPTSLYHAQVVHGRRFQLPEHEFVVCAVHVYLHFLLFFAALYCIIWTHNWWGI